jgi:xylulokinase
LNREIGSEYVFARTGLPIQPIFGLNKLLWLKQNEPTLFGRIARWLNVADYINFRLCGVQATELSLASRVMALDLKQGRWSDDLLSRVGISPGILGELVPGAQPLGRVAAQSAGITGLPPETKVVSGGHDHPCAAVGAGVFDPGVVLDSLGTSESLVIVLDKPILNPSAAASGFAVGYHVLPGRFQSIGGLATSGAAIDWFRTAFFGSLSGGVFFLPYLRVGSPPNNEANTRGSFIGLSADTTQGDLCRSLYEGLAYSAVDCLNALRASFQTDVKQIRVVGGPARNRLWMRIKASMTSEPFRVVEVEEAACRGAAVLAGLGAGCYSSIEDARQTVAFDETALSPDPQWQKVYDWGYRSVYSRIQSSLRDLHQEICRA